jgi:hypothetical protein
MKPAYQKNMTQAQTARLMEELDSEKVALICGKHQYVAHVSRPPQHTKCQECWQAYITVMVASMPPHERSQFLEALQEFAHETIQNPGEYEPFLHPEVTIVKDDPTLN